MRPIILDEFKELVDQIANGLAPERETDTMNLLLLMARAQVLIIEQNKYVIERLKELDF
jgi:hypothetical protein